MNLFESEFFDRWLMRIIIALTVLSVIGGLLVIVSLIWYAFTGDLGADIGHFIKTIKENAK
jgi:hypothetical protein